MKNNLDEKKQKLIEQMKKYNVRGIKTESSNLNLIEDALDVLSVILSDDHIRMINLEYDRMKKGL